MSIYPEDMEKVPTDISIKNCYKRIYNWHKKFGIKSFKNYYKYSDNYSRMYIKLVELLPTPKIATQADTDFIFCEVISRYMEWSYHIEDEYGIKIAAYAHYAINNKYQDGYGDDDLQKSAECSYLYEIMRVSEE